MGGIGRRATKDYINTQHRFPVEYYSGNPEHCGQPTAANDIEYYMEKSLASLPESVRKDIEFTWMLHYSR